MALHNYACIVEFSLSHSHRYMHVQNSHITNWNGIFSFLYLIFENCWSGQLLSNETIALDHWKICVLCRLHKKVFVSPQKFVSSECRDLCSWFWHGCKSEQNSIIMIIVVILAPIDLRWQWQYKIVACATFCLKVKILKQVIIKWQWQWPRYTSSILQWAIAVYHQNARMWKNCPGQRKPTVTVLSQKVELLTQLWAAHPSPLLHFREWQIIVRDDVKKYNFGFWTFPKQSCSFKKAGCKFHLMSL